MEGAARKRSVLARIATVGRAGVASAPAPKVTTPVPSLSGWHDLVVVHVHLGVRARGGMPGDVSTVGADVSHASGAGVVGAIVSAMVPVRGHVVVGA
eukprot:scaffold41152_cov65-Phaeocystis_antarctica.AAC.6